MEEQVQTNPAVEETTASKKGGFKGFVSDCWHNKHKRPIAMLCICVVLILIATLFGSMIQTAGWKYTVKDLRGEKNSGTIVLQATDKTEAEEYKVNGSVTSGLLYMPKKASADNPVPAIVLTHGLYNNREMQEQNTIELVRRGYVVLAIDYTMHGHNTDTGSFAAETFLNAAKYLWNLPEVDGTKIAVSGHSMGGSATRNALQADGVDTSYKATIDGTQVTLVGQTDEALKAGYHMGIISAGLVQANNAPTQMGSNLIAVGVLKASSDEFFFASTLAEKFYKKAAKGSVTEENYDNGTYYLKDGSSYVLQTSADKFSKGKQYYTLTNSGGPFNYLYGSQAITFIKAGSSETITEIVNAGIYSDGKLLAEPGKQKEYRTWDTESGGKLVNTVPVKSTLVSVQRKGEALASATQSIRVVYEARETHPMNHFSIQSAAHMVDFVYNAFGVSPIMNGKFIAPANQTWWLKEVFAIFGFIGIFGLLLPVLDLLLNTKAFASLKAGEGEVEEGPILLTNPRKHVSYWLSGILTAIFAGVSLKHMYNSTTLNIKKWKILTAIEGWISACGTRTVAGSTTKVNVFIHNSTVTQFATWGVACALFGIAVTAVIWLINKCLDTFLGDKLGVQAGTPFAGFKVRSWQNVLKTPLVALILLVTFYCVQNVIWKWAVVDFRFFTFDLRVFDLNRIPGMLAFVPFFFIFYMTIGALSINYRVKDLPEWATICINVLFNVIGTIILLWHSNNYFIANGVQIASSGLFYIAAIPIIPCVGFATVIARRMYVRTGNAWLAGIVNAVIMTFLACANTSIVAQPYWVLPM